MSTNENKANKISINTIKEIVKSQKHEDKTIPYSYNLNGESIDTAIVVKMNITKDDKVRFVRDVFEGCFEEDNYLPYYREDLFKIAVLEYFTNIKTNANADAMFDLVNNTDIYAQIICVIQSNTIDELSIIVDDLINWHKQEILSVQKQKLDAATEDMVKTLEQMNELIEALNAMAKSFEGIDPKEALKIYDKLANKDEDKIAKAVIDLNLARLEKE